MSVFKNIFTKIDVKEQSFTKWQKVNVELLTQLIHFNGLCHKWATCTQVNTKNIHEHSLTLLFLGVFDLLHLEVHMDRQMHLPHSICNCVFLLVSMHGSIHQWPVSRTVSDYLVPVTNQHVKMTILTHIQCSL